MSDGFRDYFVKNKEKILDDYLTLLKFPSISAKPEHKDDCKKCVLWLQNFLQGIGFETELWETKGNPILFATNLKASKKKPTLLIYNHYDVQPIDPLKEWVSPPFTPVTRNGEIYARGAADNKGQLFYVLQSLKAFHELGEELPINLKLCIEGEEEVGSPSLSKILEEKKKELKADYLAIVDVGIPDPETPAVTLGVRGLVTFDLELTGTNTDLHSGSHGGIVYNPIHALLEMLASLRDKNGCVTIPGFYDDVAPIDEVSKKYINFAFDETKYKQQFEAEATGGEKEFSPIERAWIRPTLEINGITGGYSGEGFKTVIPAKASAKISCRLVPNQSPEGIAKLVSHHLSKIVPPGIVAKVKIHPGGGKAARVSPTSKLTKAFAKAYADVFGKECQYIFEGGSIPIVTELAEKSESEAILVGLGLIDDQIHAPNEHFGTQRLERGFHIMVNTFFNLSTI